MGKINKASEYKSQGNETIMLMGLPGTGKTTLMRTLPGKTIGFLFDNAAEAAIAGATNIDYMIYKTDLQDMHPYRAGNKGKEDAALKAPKKIGAPKAWLDFSTDFIAMWNDGAFDAYDNMFIDGVTHMQGAQLDFLLHNDGRYGQIPQLSDYNSLKNGMIKSVRNLTALPINSFLIVHDRLKQEGEDGPMKFVPNVVGDLQTYLPGLFNHVFRTVTAKKAGEIRYMIQTKTDARSACIRTSWQGLPDKIDVTIDKWTEPQKYGFGKLMGGDDGSR